MSDLTTLQAAELALNLGKQLRAIIQVGEALKKIGDLEQSGMEAATVAAAALALMEQAQADLAIMKTRVNDAVRTRNDHEAAGNKALAEAKAEVEVILQRAREDGAVLLEKAQDGAADIRSTSNDAWRRHDDLMTTWAGEEKALEKRVASLREQIGAIQRNLDEAAER